MNYLYAFAFTWPWNLLGQYPVVNVPIGWAREGLPIGMQIIGNTFEDLSALQVAQQWSLQMYATSFSPLVDKIRRTRSKL